MYLGPVQLFLHGKIATQGPSLSVKPWVLLLSVLTPSLRKEDDGDAGDERDRYSVWRWRLQKTDASSPAAPRS